MQHATQAVHIFLTQLGLPSFLKTSGGKGLHVVVPIRPGYGWSETKAFSKAIVTHLAQTLPKLFVAKSGPKNRVGRIFIDYLRNGQGVTTVAAWSARARPGLGISVPVAWAELDALTGANQWTVRNVQTRLDRGNAPWKAYARSAKSLGVAMQRMEFTP
jgi:bifunctional non-homologous end joining protein LigD